MTGKKRIFALSLIHIYRTLSELIAEQVGIKKEDIISHDLFLYNRMPGTVWGADREFAVSYTHLG